MRHRKAGRPGRDTVERQHEHGIALVAVLWIVVLLSVLATALVAMSRAGSRSRAAEQSRLQAAADADAGIALALVALSDPKGGWPVDGTPRTVTFNGAGIEVSVTAESGKIDLNNADPELIQGLFEVAGAGPGAAAEMTAAIVARRSGHAASDRDDGGAVPPMPFQSLGELMALPGMTPDLYARMAPNLTLYSGSSSVDAQSAPEDVLLAIPGNTRADAEAALQARASPERSTNSGFGDLSRIIGHAFSVRATARLADGAIGRKTEVVRITGDPGQPVWVLEVR